MMGQWKMFVMKKQTLNFKSGYTLIEILVVIALIGILTTIGIAAYNDFNEQRIIRKAADEIKTYIRSAASKASNNEKDCDVCGGPDNDCSTYEEGDDLALVAWELNLEYLYIQGICGDPEVPSSQVSFGQEDFLVGVTGLTISPSDTIRFYPPASGGGTLGGGITININGDDMLLVDESGVVSEAP